MLHPTKPAPHKGSHQHGGADEVAQVYAAPGAIPKADPTGKLDTSWLPGGGGGGGSSFVAWNEEPIGIIDGSNVVFDLAHTPDPTTSVLLFLNGLLLRQGASNDYVMTGNTITFVVASTPQSGDVILATYPY